MLHSGKYIENQLEDEVGSGGPAPRNGFKAALAICVNLMILVIGVTGIFVLPWHVPNPNVSGSLSYFFGFNNQVAILTAGVALGLLCLARLVLPPSGSRNTVVEQRLATLLGSRVSSRWDRELKQVGLLGSICLLTIIIAWWSIPPYAGYGEMQYFIRRMEFLVLGGKPYIEFEFPYGPLLLYPQYWLYQLFRGNLSIENAYGVILGLHWLIGSWMIYFVFRELSAGFRSSLGFLCVIGTAGISVFTLGLNYTPFRFAWPLFSLCLVHRLEREKGSVLSAGLYPILPLIAYAVSPEMGIAVFLTLLTYAAWHGAYLRCALCLMVAPLIVAILGLETLAGILSFGRGGLSFPVFPTVHVVALLGTAGFILPVLARCAWRNHTTTGAAAAALLVLSTVTLPAALGRCDMGHVFWNQLPLWVVGFSLVAASSHRVFRIGSYASYIAVFVIAFGACFWGVYRDSMINAVRTWKVVRNYDLDKLPAPLNSNNLLRYSKPFPVMQEDLSELRAYERVGVPLSCERDVERFLTITGRYASELYPEVGMVSPATIARKYEDLDRMPVLLLPPCVLFTDESEHAFAHSKWLSDLLLYPVSLKMRVPSRFEPEFLVRDYIRENFEQIGTFRTYRVMSRKRK